MCKFYSAILMRNGDLLHNENLTSHEDIIRLFDIHDNQCNGDKFVRIEYTPEDEADYANIEKYVLNIDEEQTPEWFDEHRKYVEQRLKDIVSKRIITTDRSILTGGVYVLKDCKIDKIIYATIITMQNSQVNEMWENSQVKVMRENSQVNEMRENSQVKVMRENSQVKVMRENSQVNEMWENSQVNEMWENSQVKVMRENSRVKVMRENSQVKVMRENSQVKSNNSSNRLPEK